MCASLAWTWSPKCAVSPSSAAGARHRAVLRPRSARPCAMPARPRRTRSRPSCEPCAPCCRPRRPASWPRAASRWTTRRCGAGCARGAAPRQRPPRWPRTPRGARRSRPPGASSRRGACPACSCRRRGAGAVCVWPVQHAHSLAAQPAMLSAHPCCRVWVPHPALPEARPATRWTACPSTAAHLAVPSHGVPHPPPLPLCMQLEAP
jgi:hypothetical protein